MKELPYPNEFRIRIDELSEAVAEFELAVSNFPKDSDYNIEVNNLLNDSPTKYIIPTTYKKKPPFLSSIKKEQKQKKSKSLKDYFPCPFKTTISREELARYAIASKQNPPFLKRDIEQQSPSPLTEKAPPPVLEREIEQQSPSALTQGASLLDKNHKNFAKELSIAIELWLTICQHQEEMPPKGMKHKLISYLNKYYRKTLKSEAIERIATVANPSRFKKGGPGKSKH